MKNITKRLLALSMTILLGVGVLTGCENTGNVATDSTPTDTQSTPIDNTDGIAKNIAGDWVCIAKFIDGIPVDVDDFLEIMGLEDKSDGSDWLIKMSINADGSFEYGVEGNSVKGSLEADGTTFNATTEGSDLSATCVYDADKDLIYKTMVTDIGSFTGVYTRISSDQEDLKEYIIGEWVLIARGDDHKTGLEGGGNLLGVVFKFNEDGTCELPAGSGTYSLEGNEVTIETGQDEEYVIKYRYIEALGVLASEEFENNDEVLMSVLAKKQDGVESASPQALAGTWEPIMIFDGYNIYDYKLLEAIHGNLFDNSDERSYLTGIKFNDEGNTGMLMYDSDLPADNFAYEVSPDGAITISFPEGEDITLPMQYGNATGYLYDYTESGEFPMVIIYKKQ